MRVTAAQFTAMRLAGPDAIVQEGFRLVEIATRDIVHAPEWPVCPQER